MIHRHVPAAGATREPQECVYTEELKVEYTSKDIHKLGYANIYKQSINPTTEPISLTVSQF